MIRSRVFTYGFRLFFGTAVYALVAALVFSVGAALDADDGAGPIATITGPLTAGWKGGVGPHLGYTVLLASSLAAGFLAFLLIAFRDADAEAQAQVVHAESVPLTRAPAHGSLMPITAAGLGVLLMVGLVASAPVAMAAGIGLLGVALVWTVMAWANRATGDDATNAELYHRIIDPLRVPIVSALIIAFVVLGLSRVLLAVDKVSSIIVFSGAATLFFVVAAVMAMRPNLSRNVMTAVVALGAVAILGAAIAGLIAGEREFHHVGDTGHGAEEGHSEDEGALGAPAGPKLEAGA